MDEHIAQQVGIGVLALVAGASGWVLPYRWNLLRLRKGLDKLVPEHLNLLIPKIIGSILVVAGIVILIATAVVGKFK